MAEQTLTYSRARIQYVILPPSLHPSGNRYVWIDSVAEPVEAPAWLVALLCAAKPVPAIPLERPTQHRASPGYGQAALDAEVARVVGAPQGQRNDTLNSAAYALGQLVAGGELAAPLVESALLDAACAAGLPTGEARATIRSGMSAGEKTPRAAPRQTKAVAAHHQEECRPVSFEDCAPPPILPDMLPGILRAFPLALAEAIQVPFELALVNAIGAVAVEKFTARDALRAVRGRFPTMEKINPGLSILEERGFIAEAFPDQKKGPGRKPSVVYVVNPRMWEA